MQRMCVRAAECCSDRWPGSVASHSNVRRNAEIDERAHRVIGSWLILFCALQQRTVCALTKRNERTNLVLHTVLIRCN